MKLIYTIIDFFDPFPPSGNNNDDNTPIAIACAIIFICLNVFFVHGIRSCAYAGFAGSFGMGFFLFLALAMWAISSKIPGELRIRSFGLTAMIAVAVFFYYVPVNMTEAKPPNDDAYRQVYDALK